MKNLSLNSDLLKEARIPKAFWKLDPVTYSGDAQSLNTVNAFLRKADINYTKLLGLYLQGTVRSFKTFLLTYVLKCFLVKGYSGVYFTLEEFFNSMLSETSEVWFLVQSTQILVLDDVELLDNSRRWRSEGLVRLVKSRLDFGYPLFFASNHSIQDVASHYDRRLTTYLVENCIEVNLGDDGLNRQISRLQEKEEGI